ncbi:MAG: hypothetical protein ABR598_06775 [Candidatus Dormibacteria bacterium]
MPPADSDKSPRKRKPATRKSTTPKPASRKPASRKPAAPKTRSSRTPAVETNGHAPWPDYQAASNAWDPWDDGDGEVTGAGEGLNRTLGEWLEAVVPPEAQIHFFNAGREFAAGIQTTLEHHMRHADDDDGDEARAFRIEIE